MFHLSKSPFFYLRLASGRRLTSRCLLTILLALLTVFSSEAQQPKDRKASLGRPDPQAMKAQVVKGQTVRITLSSKTNSKATLVEYQVRDFPTLGVVGTLLTTPEDQTKATIIYQSARQSKGKVDMFSFSARYAGGYYSAPVRVIIELSDPAPKIEAPTSIDFGNLILGDNVIREILLKNTGNIEFQKHIQLTAPLELVEPSDGKLAIPPGGNLMVKIKYHPKQVGTIKSNLTLQNKPGITFFGNSIAPFETSTNKLTLLWNEKDQNRQGKIQLTNRTDKPISIKVSPPARTQYLADTPMILPPGKSGSVKIALPKEDVKSFKGILEIATSRYSHHIPLDSSPTPPQLKLELPDPALNRIDFGEAQPGESISRTFMLKNIGGSGSVIGIGALPPFQVVKNQDRSLPAAFSVGPESSAAFTVKFIAPNNNFGSFSDSLEIGTDVGAFSIRLTAVLLDPNPMAKDTPIPPQVLKGTPNTKPDPLLNPQNKPLPPSQALPPLPDLEKGIDHRSSTGFYTRDYVTREYSDGIPAPTEFSLHKAGRHHLTLAWKIPSPDQTVFEMDMRQMLFNKTNYGIESVWVPYHEVDFQRAEGMVYATLKGLNPGVIYEFRVLTAGTGGKFSKPSEPFGAWTMPPPDYRWIKWALLLIIVSIVGVLIRLYWNKHDGRMPMPTYWPRTIPWPFE